MHSYVNHRGLKAARAEARRATATEVHIGHASDIDPTTSN